MKISLLLSLFLSARILAQLTDYGSQDAVYSPERGTGTGNATNGGSHVFISPVAGSTGTADQTYRTNAIFNRDGSFWWVPQTTEPTINLRAGNVWNNSLYGPKLYIDGNWLNLYNYSHDRAYDVFTECSGNPGASGTDFYASSAAASTFTGSGVRWGAFNVGTSTSSSGVGFVGTSPNIGLLGTGLAIFNCKIRTPSTLSDGTETYTTWFGWGNTVSAVPTSGLGFRYTDSVNSGKFECVAIAGGSPTTKDSGITVATSTWLKFLITLNAGGTSATYYYAPEGTATYTPLATNTTTLPVVAGQEVGAICEIVKSAGTTSRSIIVDWIWAHVEPTNPR